ncbi:MAG: M6 family metalloprotease domain-containing protein [candidate division WOR-3 bacterium]
MNSTMGIEVQGLRTCESGQTRRGAAWILLALMLLINLVLGMPLRPGIAVPADMLTDRAAKGVDIAFQAVRDAGTRGIRNVPGDVLTLVSGAKLFPVVAISYPDYANSYSVAAFDSMLFGDWPTGSAKNYYDEVSYGRFALTGAVAGWYLADNNRAYYGYGQGDVRAAVLAKEAAAKSDADVDYSQFDNDGDGYVDAFTCIHSGYGFEETGNSADIWSHSWSFSSAGIGAYTTNDPDPVNGGYIKIDNYVIDPERSNYSAHGSMVSIGVFVHEWGHALGLPDLYDMDYSGRGLGNWCVMSGGAWGGDGNSPWKPVHMCPWAKMELGWLNPAAVRGRKLYSIPQIETNPTAYWLIGRQRTFKEYWLVENRRQISFDTLLWGPGLMVYHIDDSVIARRRPYNTINTGNGDWKYGVALEQADGLNQLYSTSSPGDANDPFPGGTNNTRFDSTATNPNSKTNYPSASPLVTGVHIKNIPASAPVMSCTLASGVIGAFTGGPDAGNYAWIDSDTSGGPEYCWIEPLGATLLGTGDDVRYNVTLPFEFSFYGTKYTSVWVCSNGWLSFGSDPGTSEVTNTTLPNTAAPNAAVYAFWDDLDVVSSDDAGIYLQILGSTPTRRAVITWKNARVKGAPTYNQVTFQVVLCEDSSKVILQYADCAVGDSAYNWGRSATVGVENGSGTVGLQYLAGGSPLGNLLANTRAIRFSEAIQVQPPLTRRQRAIVLSEDGIASTLADTVFKYGQTSAEWNVVGVRSDANWDIRIWNIDFNTQRALSQTTAKVDFCATDCNHAPLDSMGVEVWRVSGTAGATVEYEGGFDRLVVGTNGPFSWPAGDVVEAWGVSLQNRKTYTFTLDITSGSADMGFALFKSGTAYYFGRPGAVAIADANGSGGDETFNYTSKGNDYYGLVVWANDTCAATYRILVTIKSAPAGVEDDPALVSDEFGIISVRPELGSGRTVIEYSVPEAANIQLGIFDVRGNAVRTLERRLMPRGAYRVAWDGRDDQGRLVSPGIYYCRLEGTGLQAATRKLLQLR